MTRHRLARQADLAACRIPLGGAFLDVWVVAIGEPLPGTGQRLWRSGAMAAQFAREGHAVTWWTSSFDHFQKRHVPQSVVRRAAPRGVDIQMLECRGYGQNISISRLVSHIQLARAFDRAARSAAPPDLILCSFPPAELALAATRYARRRGTPVFLDVRDLWPDVWRESARSRLKRAAMTTAGTAYRRLVRRSCEAATGFIGTTPEFLAWAAEHAGRKVGPVDRVVPIGYPAGEPMPPGELAAEVARLGLRQDSPAIRAVFLGSIGPQFDFGPILAAAAEVEDHDATFVLAGAGADFEELRARARGLANVVLPGHVDARGVRALLSWANVGLAPYNDTPHWRGNIANKPYEYMSGGLSVVAGVHGALANLLAKHECGDVYDPRDPHALPQLIHSYLANPATLVARRAAARQAYEKHFSAERTYARLADELLDTARAPSAEAGGSRTPSV